MSTIDWNDIILEFYEVCLHNLLYSREVYPRFLFEQRRYLGALVWQSRHPDINAYIRRVLDNAKPLLNQGVVDRLVFAVTTKDNKPYDHVTIKCLLCGDNVGNNKTFQVDKFRIIEEELRSSVLRLCMTDASLGKLPEDCTWKVMVITKPSSSRVEEETVQNALTTGEWLVDNNQTPQNIATAMRVQARSSSTQSESEGSDVFPLAFTTPAAASNLSDSIIPKLKPIKSFRDHQINLTLYAHVFHS